MIGSYFATVPARCQRRELGSYVAGHLFELRECVTEGFIKHQQRDGEDIVVTVGRTLPDQSEQVDMKVVIKLDDTTHPFEVHDFGRAMPRRFAANQQNSFVRYILENVPRI